MLHIEKPSLAWIEQSAKEGTKLIAKGGYRQKITCSEPELYQYPGSAPSTPPQLNPPRPTVPFTPVMLSPEMPVRPVIPKGSSRVWKVIAPAGLAMIANRTTAIEILPIALLNLKKEKMQQRTTPMHEH